MGSDHPNLLSRCTAIDASVAAHTGKIKCGECVFVKKLAEAVDKRTLRHLLKRSMINSANPYALLDDSVAETPTAPVKAQAKPTNAASAAKPATAANSGRTPATIKSNGTIPTGSSNVLGNPRALHHC